MKQRGLIQVLITLATLLFWCLPVAGSQIPKATAEGSIPSLSEPGQGLDIKAVSAETGFVTFASTSSQGILLPLAATTSAEERALSFVAAYGGVFGLMDTSQVHVLRAAETDVLGFEHVRFQQVHRGVPVRGAEFIVHMKGSRVMAANGHVVADLPDDVTPALRPEQAQFEASRLIGKHRSDEAAGALYSKARLEIFNRGLLSDHYDQSRLAWFVEATGPKLREYIWVDAQSGAILLNFSQLTDAKSRTVYTANHSDTLPGTLVRSEGGPPTGDADEDNAYTYAGITYDYYLTNHGRDSFDNAGATIISTAHYCPVGSCPSFQNAFWDGSQMVYGDGFASADDVVAHELTHAVTERTANLFYYVQSGALNESFSDIFGETVDLTDGVGNDSSGVRWKIGEDLPIGAIRDMMTPTLFSNPGKMSDSAFFVCSSAAATDGSDSGGVHTNSGIPNHSYALMVDGGTYNGKTITGIGLTKAAKIEYRALTVYLTSGATFLDDYNALNQSCADLTGTVGITSANCVDVTNAMLAVELNATWACSGATPAPRLCTAGSVLYTSLDTFESSLGNWTPTNSNGTWGLGFGFAKGGVLSAYGTDPGVVSDHRLSLTAAVTIPTGGRFYFDHAFEFENDPVTGATYDGGVLEYSTNGGSTWADAAGFIDAGQTYGGVVNSCCTNPLAGRTAFVKSSYGYTGTRLDISSLAGQSVKFRFRIGSDFSVGSLGWLVDNVAIYRCTFVFTDDPLVVGSTRIKAVHILELRSRIDAIRATKSLGAFPWIDPNLTTGSTRIKAVHILNMRTALAQAYAAAGLTAPVYTDPGLAAGTTMKAIHIQQLRSAVVAIEGH
jgi:Zn-dependent metalloprotease